MVSDSLYVHLAYKSKFYGSSPDQWLVVQWLVTPKIPPSFLLSLCPPGYWGLWPGDYKCHYLLLLDSQGATSLLTTALLLLLLAQEQGHFKRQLCYLNISANSTLWNHYCSKTWALRQLPDSIVYQWLKSVLLKIWLQAAAAVCMIWGIGGL